MFQHRYALVNTVDVNPEWVLFGDISEPRTSLDGSQSLCKFTELPDGLVEITDFTFLEGSEWSEPFITPLTFDELIEDLIQAATDFGLGDFIAVFFFANRAVMLSNDKEQLRTLFETATDAELELTNEDGISPRIYALALLE